MRHLLIVGFLSILVAVGQLAGQTPPPSQPPPPPSGQQPPAPGAPPPEAPRPPRPAAATPAARVTLLVSVTDEGGNPVGDTKVYVTGPLSRSGTTNEAGQLRFTGLRAGTYRLRFEGPAHVPFEREVTVKSGQAEVDVTLSPAPEPEPPPPPPPPPPPVRRVEPPGEPKAVYLPDFIEKNLIGRGDQIKESALVPQGYATAQLLQLREPLEEHVHADEDEIIYVIAGQGTLRLGDRQQAIDAGWFAAIPRGTPHSIVRRGRNPLVVLSIMAPPAD
jgi:mannose-6-phosphate isomerase-like protein (cupin superfamily)